MSQAKVSPGSKVTVKMDGEQKDFTIVDPEAIDPQNGCISFNSPIAQAVLRAEIGQSIDVELPNGKSLHIEVMAVV